MWLATSRQVDQFRDDLNAVVSVARAEAEQFWRGIDKSDPVFVRAEMIEFMQDLNLIYGEIAAGVAADYFDEIRAGSDGASGEFRSLAAEPVPLGQVAGSTGWALSTADPESALAGVADRLIKQAGRDTVVGNVARDRSARYVRVPRGDTCAFCIMVASRGAVYASKEAAQFVVGRGQEMTTADRRARASGNGRIAGRFTAGGKKTRGTRKAGEKYHDFCDCQPVAIWTPKDFPEDYDQKHYEGIYLKGVAEAGGTDPTKVLAGIRKVTGSH